MNLIVTHFEVETDRTNPFDYLLDPSADTLPIAYGEQLSGSLARYCLRADDDDSVAKFARSLAEAAGGRTLGFSVREKGENPWTEDMPDGRLPESQIGESNL